MDKATPRPWVYAPDAPAYGQQSPYMIWTGKGPGYGTVAQTKSTGLMPEDPERQRADAELICTAVNCFDDLVEALEAVKSFGSRGATDEGISVSYFVESALKKARGK